MDGSDGAAAPVAASEELRAERSPVCTGCGVGLSMSPKSRRKTDRCRSCVVKAMNASPEMRARQRAGIAAKFADPVKRAAHIEVAKNNIAKAQAKPGFSEWLREHGRRIYREVLNTPEMRERARLTATARGRKRTATVLAWCPPKYLDAYRYLKAVKRFTPAESRALIEQQIADDKLRNSPAAQARREIRAFDAAQRARAAREQAQAY